VNDDEQTRTNIQALGGIQTHGLNVQAIKAFASDHAATGTAARNIPVENLIVVAAAVGHSDCPTCLVLYSSLVQDL
jgi:hypothetical protein